MKPPKWLNRYVKHVQAALGLQIWELRITASSLPNPDNPEADANTRHNCRYLYADISFRHELVCEESVDAKVTACHELLHLCQGHYCRLVTDVVDKYVPDKDRAFVDEQLTDAEEQMIVRLSRECYRLIEPSWKAAERERKEKSSASQEPSPKEADVRREVLSGRNGKVHGTGSEGREEYETVVA